MISHKLPEPSITIWLQKSKITLKLKCLNRKAMNQVTERCDLLHYWAKNREVVYLKIYWSFSKTFSDNTYFLWPDKKSEIKFLCLLLFIHCLLCTVRIIKLSKWMHHQITTVPSMHKKFLHSINVHKIVVKKQLRCVLFVQKQKLTSCIMQNPSCMELIIEIIQVSNIYIFTYQSSSLCLSYVYFLITYHDNLGKFFFYFFNQILVFKIGWIIIQKYAQWGLS